MRLSMDEAEKIVRQNLPDAEIKGKALYQGLYLFLAPWGDPLEGRLLPFFSVDPETGKFTDFDPQSYDNPAEVLDLLDPIT